MNYAWISGTRFYWVNRTKIYSIEGSASGVLDLSKAKSFWMEGPLLCYYDAYGRRRSIQMSSLSPRDIDATKQQRAIWVPEGKLLEIRDSAGERRRLVHTDHSDNYHADYADHDNVARVSDIVHLDHPHVDSWFFYDEPAEYHQYNEQTGYSESPHSDHSDHSDVPHKNTTIPHADVEHTDQPIHTDKPHSDRPYNEATIWSDEGHIDHSDASYQDYGQSGTYADWTNRWQDHADVPHSDHDDQWSDYNIIPYYDHTDHADEPHQDSYEPHENVLHGDWTNMYHADQAGEYLNYQRYSDRPYQDYSDHEDVSHADYSDHANQATAGHLDSPRYEGIF